MSNELKKFNQLLSVQPRPKEVGIMQGNEYVPIQVQEAKLDDIYNGLWQVRNMSIQLIANEVVTSLELGVFHPIAKEWIWRSGIGSVPVQQAKGSKIRDMVDTKIPNALQKNAPASKAFAFKNACQSLGVTFGRELNRSLEEDIVPSDLTVAIIESQEERAIKELSEVTEVSQLGELLKKYMKVPGFPKKIGERKKELVGVSGHAKLTA